jgi:hypothetical protein
MRVVRVAASIDYEGIFWTKLFSSVDRAVEFLRSGDADEFGGIGSIDVAWVGVDSDDEYERILNFRVKARWLESDTYDVSFDGHDREVFDYNA